MVSKVMTETDVRQLLAALIVHDCPVVVDFTNETIKMVSPEGRILHSVWSELGCEDCGCAYGSYHRDDCKHSANCNGCGRLVGCDHSIYCVVHSSVVHFRSCRKLVDRDTCGG